MCGLLPFTCGGRCAARSPPALEGPRPPTGGVRSGERLCALVAACWWVCGGGSALPLLVAGGGRADDHHAAVATDDPALVADRLDAGLDLHGTGSLLVAVDDAAAGQVVGRELHDHAVLGEDADVVLPHLAADVGQDLVTVLQLHAEHRVGERLDDPALDLDGPVLLRHVLR